MRFAFVLVFGMVTACADSAPRPVPPIAAPVAVAPPSAPFFCERAPARQEHRVRSCFRYREHCTTPAGCFERASAVCYVRSAVDAAAQEWQADRSQVMCFPSPSDCTDDWGTWAKRPEVGRDRYTTRPPLLTPCRESRPDEADY